MTGRKRNDSDQETPLDEIIERITVDAYSDDEQLWAFRQFFEDEWDLPADGFVLGEPVSVTAVGYDGNARRGLTAACRKEDGSEHVVSLADVAFGASSLEARYLAAYRKWAGLEPVSTSSVPRKKHRVSEQDLDISRPVELILLNVRLNSARCRVAGTERTITLRCRDVWLTAPGEIVTVQPRKYWRFKNNPYLSGSIESRRIDIPALGLHPLGLEDCGTWDPAADYWREEDERLSEWEKEIMQLGPRSSYKMERVLPGGNPEDPFDDPIIQSIELKQAGDTDGAYRILMDLLEADLRCLDAHCHLGNLVFDLRPHDALRHYEIGRRIGELSLGEDFEGVLLWGYVDNRPFLRCLQAYGICLWRTGRTEEAGEIFRRILRLSPLDNQGIRFLLPDVQAGKPWTED